MSPEKVPEIFVPSVDVVICAYTEQRWDDLSTAIESCRRQTHRPARMIVVVDHNERLLARARESFDDAVVVPNRDRKGLSGARNTGVEEVTSDFVAFLDDDAAAAPTWLEFMVGELTDGPDRAGGGGTVEPIWETGRPWWFPEEFGWVVGCTYRGLPEHPAEVRNPVGASMVFLAQAIRDVGGFDSGLGRIGVRPFGCEETELSIRIRRRFGPNSIIHVPDSVVHHKVPAERSTWGYFVRRGWAEGRSKATVVDRTSADEGLESERRYVSRVLTSGVARGVVRPPQGWARAAAIVVGTAATGSGFVAGQISHRVAVNRR